MAVVEIDTYALRAWIQAEQPGESEEEAIRRLGLRRSTIKRIIKTGQAREKTLSEIAQSLKSLSNSSWIVKGSAVFPPTAQGVLVAIPIAQKTWKFDSFADEFEQLAEMLAFVDSTSHQHPGLHAITKEALDAAVAVFSQHVMKAHAEMLGTRRPCDSQGEFDRGALTEEIDRGVLTPPPMDLALLSSASDSTYSSTHPRRQAASAHETSRSTQRNRRLRCFLGTLIAGIMLFGFVRILLS